ncbi:MAG: ATP-binding cassette domain-containing protein [Phycisphaerales bacterium]
MTSSGNDGGAAVASSAAGAAGTGAAAMASRSDYAIDLAHVAKTYRGRKKVRALRGIEMRVHRGEVFGLLGPNGAGKSTLVKILMTVISPSECHGTMLGEQVGRKETLGRVGYLAEHHRFPDYLTGAQVLDFFGAMAKVPGAERKKRIPRLLELVGMKDWANQKIKSYSKGMRQRVGIAQALMNEPDLILLDEPTDGVDPVGRRDIRNLVQHLKDEGKTVFVNSHLLSELEMVCDRVAILVQGVVSKQGTLDELTSDKKRYEIEVAGDAVQAQTAFRAALPGAVGQGEFQPAMEGAAGHAADAPPTSSPLARRVGLHGNLATGEWVEIERNTLRVGTTDPAAIQPILDGLRERGVMIRSVRPMRPSLEDLFMEAVTDPMTGEVLKPGAADGPGGGARHSARGLVDGGGGATGAESAGSSGGEVRP